MQQMTDRERFLFDLNGYLVVPGVLTAEEVTALNAGVDEHLETAVDHRVGEMPPPLRGPEPRRLMAGMLTWPRPHCDPFRRLLAHPGIRPYLNTLLGPGWHLDQEPFVFLSTPGAEGLTFHGSTSVAPWGAFQYDYANGVMRCGMIVLEFHLNDQAAGQGGFACIPGSHKANLATWPELLNYESDQDLYANPGAGAGDVIIFSEATIHGTLPWRAGHERRVALYRFCPMYLQNGGFPHTTQPPEWVSELTEAERVVMEPPYITARARIEDDGTVTREGSGVG
jgi:hypothetical protein